MVGTVSEVCSFRVCVCVCMRARLLLPASTHHHDVCGDLWGSNPSVERMRISAVNRSYPLILLADSDKLADNLSQEVSSPQLPEVTKLCKPNFPKF